MKSFEKSVEKCVLAFVKLLYNTKSAKVLVIIDCIYLFFLLIAHCGDVTGTHSSALHLSISILHLQWLVSRSLEAPCSQKPQGAGPIGSIHNPPLLKVV